MTDQADESKPLPRIEIRPNGPYRVYGGPPLVHKTQVVSENGEPLTWVKDFDYHAQNIPGRDYYSLCRCGQSKKRPFCDGTHKEVHFDGTETADTYPSAARALPLPRGERLIVRKDPELCMQAGFCGFADAGIFQLMGQTGDPKVRALVMGMVERCPSGALTYRIEQGQPEIEPDLPVQIAVTTEITSEGPIDGPLWVSGGIAILRSDGQPFETRNRVTLCNCGLSCRKPLCDGTHRSEQEQALLQKRKG
jgi:CDGSH-type Zn-finger protein/uncharacterized Fe-S cluster protein YjdI